jgi:hypothetical protein
VKVNNGVATFDNIGLIGPPGQNGKKFFIKSAAVNPSLIINYMGDSFYRKIEPIFIVDFRNCREGEEFTDG